MSLRFRPLCLGLLAVALAAPAQPARAEARTAAGAVFTVTTAADAGPGSLRQAITDANASVGLDAIEFSIDGGGSYQEIFLLSTLPHITDPVTIDGDTQGCDTSEGKCIRLDGDALVDDPTVNDGGLILLAGGSTVDGLVLTRFYRDDVLAAIGIYSADNAITGCYVGTDRTGMITDPDGTPDSGDELGNGFGIVVATYDGFGSPSTGNVIGGTEPGDRNVIGGNSFGGVYVDRAGTRDNLVIGNHIGIDAAGTGAIGNGVGLVFNREASENTARGNVVSGNIDIGIGLAGKAFRNQVVENLVGTDATGTTAVPNGTLQGLASLEGIGITITGGQDNVIEGNVVSGNLLAGIVLGGDDATVEPILLVTSGNTIRGNRLGTDADGTAPIPNGVPGIADVGFGAVLFAAPGVTVTGNTFGGDDDDDANLIAYNTSAGIGAEGPGVVGNVIDGNLIGVDADGGPAPNGQVGILLRNGPSGNRIGAAGAVDFSAEVIGNYIAYQPAAVALGAFTGGNEVAFNTFVGAPGAYLPIDLGADGPTADDGGDADEGPNRLQNTPSILAAPISDDEITVRYAVDTAPESAAYPLTVRFYGQVMSAVGLGHYPLGSATYTAPGEATATFANALNDPPVVVATATDAAGNTGEVTLRGVAVAETGGPEATVAVRIGPNPTTGPLRVSFALAAPGEASLAVYDVLGREVASARGRLGAGPQHLALDATLPAGVYVWRLAVGDQVETGHVTVAR
ncbi:hypothetical protein [Rubrivirga sp. IMCC43871]|uniref:hypothetical protein n=1 Tax=Rubrivirga sp. IMCC43871 TaxID=3391575 RepID=UPI003990274C